MPPVLLIDMPAESAARLLTLSLVEELARLGPVGEQGDGGRNGRWPADRVDAYHGAAGALRSGVASFGNALRGSVTRKIRRRLRTLARAAADVRAIDRQLAWIASYGTPAENDAAPAPTRDAATWLAGRLARERIRAAAVLERQHRLRQRVVRRLTKRLGVYTAEVRLEEAAAQQTFAMLTAQQVRRAGDAWRDTIATVQSEHDRRGFRRLLRIATSLERLLMPVQSYVSGALALRASVADMLDILRRLDDAHAMHGVLVRAAERTAASHAGGLLRQRTWLVPADATPATEDDFIWLGTGADEFTAGIAAVAGELEAR